MECPEGKFYVCVKMFGGGMGDQIRRYCEDISREVKIIYQDAKDQYVLTRQIFFGQETIVQKLKIHKLIFIYLLSGVYKFTRKRRTEGN